MVTWFWLWRHVATSTRLIPMLVGTFQTTVISERCALTQNFSSMLGLSKQMSQDKWLALSTDAHNDNERRA